MDACARPDGCVHAARGMPLHHRRARRSTSSVCESRPMPAGMQREPPTTSATAAGESSEKPCSLSRVGLLHGARFVRKGSAITRDLDVVRACHGRGSTHDEETNSLSIGENGRGPERDGARRSPGGTGHHDQGGQPSCDTRASLQERGGGKATRVAFDWRETAARSLSVSLASPASGRRLRCLLPGRRPWWPAPGRLAR